MRDLAELNINEGGEAVDRPVPTSDQITSVERIIGAKLPSSYLEFLKFANGGHPELDSFEFNDEGVLQEWSVDRFFHISSDLASSYNYRTFA